MNVNSSVLLGGAAATICVVDDDPSMLKALERLLLSAGLSARFFREPLSFLKYATNNPVRVALIDIWIPRMSGLKLLKELRSVSPGTRAIIVTADDEDSVRSVAMQNGATAFFAKPFEDDIFLDTIRQTMAIDEPETPHSERGLLGLSSPHQPEVQVEHSWTKVP
jgi:FixJ family two-component response regulator